jgi:hypothetical protein
LHVEAQRFFLDALATTSQRFLAAGKRAVTIVESLAQIDLLLFTRLLSQRNTRTPARCFIICATPRNRKTSSPAA